ncbi:MAG: hypothetical protein MZW92_68850 [Comamonadaceae bacterium]|nr:hypothetical protein [Comamonadaceae bacterium]
MIEIINRQKKHPIRIKAFERLLGTWAGDVRPRQGRGHPGPSSATGPSGRSTASG